MASDSRSHGSQDVTNRLSGHVNLGPDDQGTAGNQDGGITCYHRSVGCDRNPVGCDRNPVSDHCGSIGNDRHAVTDGPGVSDHRSISGNDRCAVGDDLWGTADDGRIGGDSARSRYDRSIGYHGSIR